MTIISYIVIAIVEIVVIDITARYLIQCNRISNLKSYLLYMIYILFSILQTSFTYSVQINLLVSTILTFIVCAGYQTSWRNRLLITLISEAIGLTSEGVLWLLIRNFTGLSGFQISPNLWYYTFTTFGAAIIELCLIIIFYKAINYLRKHVSALYVFTLSLSAILLISLLLLLVTFAESPYLSFALIIVVLMLISLALSIGLFQDQMRVQQERLRLDFLEQQSHDQLAHYTALYENSNEVHKIRHDLKNFIIGARALAAQKDYDGLAAQLEQFQESVQPNALVDTGNPVLDAVLTAKQTAVPNIEFQMNIVQLNCQHIDPMDVAMLAASALDNAIEGCANINSPYIEISVQRKNEMISLIVKNPTTNMPEVKHGRIVTTKPDPERHGYGILGMQRIVDKYDGNLRWSVKDGTFILSIFLQDKPMITA